MSPHAPRPRGARPVGDAPVQALAARSEALAKGWLLALLDGRPLADAAAVPAAALARDGPQLCATACRALASDEALAELAARTAQLAELTGAQDGPQSVESVEALRAVLWTAVLEALPQPRPGQLEDLADRLAHVTASYLAAALGEPRARPRAACLPDRRSWSAALDRRLTEGARLDERTAVLVAELDGLKRLRASGAPDTLERASTALVEELVGAGLAVHEAGGCAWAMAPRWGRGRAEALARRLADAVAAIQAPHGAPLCVSVGLAVHPDDGRDAGSLCAYAEEAMLAARAAGITVVA